MSFTLLPITAVIAGAILLVLALYLLQWLRTRTSVVVVAAVYFWQQVNHQAPARVLWQKFRYWSALLLSSLIVLLIWLAFAGIQLGGQKANTQSLYFLDNSVLMLAHGNMAAAKVQLMSDFAADATPIHQVWLGDAGATLLLKSDESKALLAPRLAAVEATVHQTSFLPWLQALQARTAANTAVNIYYYGVALNRAALAAIPANFTFHPRYIAEPVSRNLGIVALGQAPAASAVWGKVDVMFQLYASDDTQLNASLIKFALNGHWFQPSDVTPLGEGRFKLSNLDVSTAPQQLQLALTQADDFTADDTATLTLATLPTLKVQLGYGLPTWLPKLLTLDKGVSLVTHTADVSVCLAGDAQCPSAAASLVLDDSLDKVVFAAPTHYWQASLQNQWRQNGWQTLVEQQQFPALVMQQSDTRQVRLSVNAINQLLQEQSAELPRIISQSLRWLANNSQMTPYLAIGEPWPQGPMTTSTLEPLPLEAGLLENSQGQSWSAALLSTTDSRVITERPALEAETSMMPLNANSMLFWCLMVALLLLLAEWMLIQRGHLP